MAYRIIYRIISYSLRWSSTVLERKHRNIKTQKNT